MGKAWDWSPLGELLVEMACVPPDWSSKPVLELQEEFCLKVTKALPPELDNESRHSIIHYLACAWRDNMMSELTFASRFYETPDEVKARKERSLAATEARAKRKEALPDPEPGQYFRLPQSEYGRVITKVEKDDDGGTTVHYESFFSNPHSSLDLSRWTEWALNAEPVDV